MSRRLALSCAALVMLFVAAACGQKPGVSEEVGGFGVAAGVPVIDPTTGATIDPVTGDVIDPVTGEVISEGTGSVTGGGTTTGGGETSGGDAGGGDTGGGDVAEPGEPSGGDATGVEEGVIRIGVHAPITGAAPVPSAAFERGKDLYWEWLKSNNESINGRDVEVSFRNDNYNPSQAVAACKEMVEKDKVFLLYGLAGVDQISACARYAASVGVPYISAGVSEIGLENLPNYFAMWQSYAQQGPLLTDMLTTKLGAEGEKNGMVRFNTPGFQDAHDSWVASMEDAGATVDYDRAVSKTAGTSDAQTVATELAQQQIENVYVLTSPTWFIQLVNAASNQNYKPQWVGVGLSMGIDTVPNVTCRNNQGLHNARFLNPFPAVIDANRFDPNYQEAGGRNDTTNGSIEFGLWGASKVIGELLKLPGKELTRERFVYFAERAQRVKTGVFPDVSYTPENHFGGTGMHLVRADCGPARWVTEQPFVSDF